MDSGLAGSAEIQMGDCIVSPENSFQIVEQSHVVGEVNHGRVKDGMGYILLIQGKTENWNWK